MEFETYAFSFTAALFVGMLVCLEIGRQIGARQLAKEPEGARVGVAAVDGALFGLLGYGMAGAKSRSWLHRLGLAFVMVATIYVILDMEYPRLGLIRVDAFDQALVELRNNMK